MAGLRIRPKLVVSVALLAVTVMLLAWGFVDASSPDDEFLQTTPIAGATESNGFSMLAKLSDEVDQLSRRDAALTSVLRHGFGSAPEASNHASTLRVVSLLPDQLDGIAADGGIRAPDGSAFGNNAGLEQRVVRLMRLAASVGSGHLERGDTTTAWRYAWSTLELSALLQRDAVTLRDLVVAHASLTLAAAGVARGIENGLWTSEQLDKLARWNPPKSRPDQLETALKRDYRDSFAETAPTQDRVGRSHNQFTYHPNATKRAWIAALHPVLSQLSLGQPVAALRKLQRRSALSPPLFGRNEVGYVLLTRSLPSYEAPLEQHITSAMKVRLLRVGAALAQYKRTHRQLPSRVEDLATAPASLSIVDDWSTTRSGFRYQPTKRLLYSVGPNGIDDGGHYRQGLSYDQQTDDYGVILER